METFAQFALEIDKLKSVTRKTKPAGMDRYENSAEHSWHVALLAHALAPYAAAPVNVDRVVRMLLIHDVGEIDTGDTIVYAETGWEERKAAELAAIRRIFGMLPAEMTEAFVALWQEFEAEQSADAHFAHALDRATPMLLNLANQGQTWRENGISYERVVSRTRPEIEPGCPALWAYLETRLVEARSAGWFSPSARV